MNLPLSLCPFCEAKLDAATYVQDRSLTPSPGDLSMCLVCTSMLKFDDDLHLVGLSTAEFRELPDDVRDYIHAMQRVARGMDRSAL